MCSNASVVFCVSIYSHSFVSSIIYLENGVFYRSIVIFGTGIQMSAIYIYLALPPSSILLRSLWCLGDCSLFVECPKLQKDTK